MIGVSQTGPRAAQLLSCEFENKDVEYEEVAAISNVLKIYNNSTKEFNIRVKVTVPGGWRSLNDPEKSIQLPAKDTVYVPVRLLGNSRRTRGGIKYNISAVVTIVETGQVITNTFMAGKPKISNMKMEVQPGSRLYFPNGKNFLPFKVELINDGNERQDMLLSVTKTSNDVMITDSVGKFLQKKFTQLSIKPYNDTLLPFGVALLTEVRNQRRIDTYGYKFDITEKSRQHTVYLKAIEPMVGGANSTDAKGISKSRISKTLEFIKLNNNKRVNDFDGDVLPLSVLANVNQLFNQQPVMNLSLNGRKRLNEKSYVSYLMQNTFSYYKYSNNSYKSAFGQVGYFHEKGSIQFGNGVQLSLPQVRSIGNSGAGLAATYLIKTGHKIGFFYSSKRGALTDFAAGSYNLGYSGTFGKIVTGLGLSLSNASLKYRTQLLSLGVNMPIGKNQTFNFRTSLERYQSASNVYVGQLFSVNYGISYLQRKANSRIQFTYHKLPDFLTGSDSIVNKPLFNLGLFNNFAIRKYFTIKTQHNYYSNPIFDADTQMYRKNILFSNLIFFGLDKRKKNMLVPGMYVNYSEYFAQRLISQGLQFNISKSDPQENLRLGLTIKGGFNRLLSHPQYGLFFTSQINSFVTYKTLNLNARYFYGPQSQFDVISSLSRQSKYSQVLFLSAGHQYQFKNKHFVFENTMSYNYTYINLRQNVSLFSQLFYFAQGGWRFNFNLNFNYNVSDNIRFTYDPAAQGQYQAESGTNKQKTKSVQFGFGVKKDLGIPLPKKIAKRKYTTCQFKAFLDINGNRMFDKDEAPLENVIVRLDDYEAQTDINGELSFENIQMGKYRMQVLSLENLGAWFPIKSDSIDITGPGINYVPFTRGVQILGTVEVNREKFSAGMRENLDVSRIKIFLIDSAGRSVTTLTDKEGNFNFYLPYGNYTLRFDESVLGAEFELSQNDVPVQLYSGMESFYHSFYIVERKRKVKTKKFGADGTVIQDSQKTEGSDSPVENDNQKRKK
jgi:hypothetical protein